MNLQDGVNLGEAIFVTLFSMGIVFLTLVVISFILSGFKSAFYKDEKKTPVKKEVPPISDNAKVESTEELVDNDEEIVAVIAAAIAAQTGEAVENIYIRNIKRATQNSPAWAVAGRQEAIQNKLNRR